MTAQTHDDEAVVAKAVRRRGPAKTGNPVTDRQANAAKAAAKPASPNYGDGSAQRAKAAAAKKAAKAAPATKAKAKAPKVAPKLPKGYAVKYQNGAYDLAKKGEGAAEGSPNWIVICTSHGTTTTAAKAKEGDALGSRAGRSTWCKKCQAA